MFALKFWVLKIDLKVCNYWEVWSCLFGRSDLYTRKFLISSSAIFELEQILFLSISKYLRILRFLKLTFQLLEVKVMV
jgi:hypothetical protein